MVIFSKQASSNAEQDVGPIESLFLLSFEISDSNDTVLWPYTRIW